MNPRAAALAPDARRAQIVAAATPLVREHGTSVTTKQIAAAAGIAEGTVFRAFADKEKLLHAVVEDVLRPEPALQQIATIDLDRPLAAVVRDIAVTLQERVRSVFDIIMAVHWMPEAARRPDPQPDPIMQRVIEILERFRDTLSVEPAKAADVLRILIFAGTHPMINEGRPLLAQDITEVLLHGISRRDGPSAASP